MLIVDFSTIFTSNVGTISNPYISLPNPHCFISGRNTFLIFDALFCPRFGGSAQCFGSIQNGKKYKKRPMPMYFRTKSSLASVIDARCTVYIATCVQRVLMCYAFFSNFVATASTVCFFPLIWESNSVVDSIFYRFLLLVQAGLVQFECMVYLIQCSTHS